MPCSFFFLQWKDTTYALPQSCLQCGPIQLCFVQYTGGLAWVPKVCSATLVSTVHWRRRGFACFWCRGNWFPVMSRGPLGLHTDVNVVYEVSCTCFNLSKLKWLWPFGKESSPWFFVRGLRLVYFWDWWLMRIRGHVYIHTNISSQDHWAVLHFMGPSRSRCLTRRLVLFFQSFICHVIDNYSCLCSFSITIGRRHSF